MPRYAPLPVHDNEDQELNRAFNVEDDEDENAPDHTPLLARGQPSPGQARTPQTASHQRTIDGRYNFEYDFPPPGSPPRELAGPNHWGNSNGVVVPGPVQYDPNSNRRNWISRTWATLTGRAGRETQPVGHSIGGGTSNDGVFFNLSSRPTRPTITEPPAATSQTPPVDPESIFHAPEIAREDAPPSYYAAQADVAPAYTVLATAPDDFTIDSLPAGSIIGFLWAFTVSVFLEWIGFVLAYMLTSSHAGRCGAKAGLGISFVRLGLWFRNRADNNPSGNDGPEGLWWGALDGLNTTSHVSPYIPSSFNSTGYKHLHFGYNSTTPDPHLPMKGLSSFPLIQWVAIFLMTVGWFLFMVSILQFWRVKKWERGIRASTQSAQVAPQDHQLLSNLQIALGIGAGANHNAHDRSSSDTDIDQLEAARRSGAAHPEASQEQMDEAGRYENRLRRDLSRLGYL